MASSLLQPPTNIHPATALRLSQQAPSLLGQNRSSLTSSLPLSFFSSESPDTWTIYENLLLSCLRTRDDESARQCLEKLTTRFGESNERVMGLKGMYSEATAENHAALGEILKEYEGILADDPTNAPISKRRVALLRSSSRTNEAITALVELLDSSPTDAEAWSELSDLYFSQKSYPQAIFSLEEVLLDLSNILSLYQPSYRTILTSFASPQIHARLGEITYISGITTSSDGSAATENERGPLTDSIRSFCRSIELCDDYLRGYYGLKLATSRLLTLHSSSSSAVSSSSSKEMSSKELEKLNELATAKLAEIVRRSSAGEKGWTGYDQAEVIAARELLDRDSKSVER